MHWESVIAARIAHPPLGRRLDTIASRPVEHVLEQTVAEAFDVEARRLRSGTRGSARVALARQVAMYLGHVECGISRTDVGRLFSRDRTTVAHACTIVEERRDDPAFDRAVELLERIARILCWRKAPTCRKPS